MMQHITGIPRNQMVFSSLEDMILPDNPVRLVDAFVEALSIQSLGFKIQTLKSEGCASPTYRQTSSTLNCFLNISI